MYYTPTGYKPDREVPVSEGTRRITEVGGPTFKPDHDRTYRSADLRDRYAKAMTFAEFVRRAHQHPELWRNMTDRARAPIDLVERARRLAEPRRLLVLLEDWCGDAVNTIPVLAAFADAAPALELRVLARDENLDLMDAHLSPTGARAIPVVIVLDENFAELGWWGSRPAELQAWVSSPEAQAMDPAARYRQVRRWYARDHGRSALTEILELLERTTPPDQTPGGGTPNMTAPTIAADSAAQLPPGIKVTPLVEKDLAEVPHRYVQSLVVELEPGVTEPRHVHGGDEFLYLLGGDGAVEIDGGVSLLPVGSVTHVAAGRTKALRNTSASAPLRVLAFLVLDRNKPSFQLAESAHSEGVDQSAEEAGAPSGAVEKFDGA